jgi:hypothetical protein
MAALPGGGAPHHTPSPAEYLGSLDFNVGPAQRVLTGIVAVGLGAVGFVGGRTMLRPKQNIVQPIEFNHAVHTEALECEDCHQYFRESAHSGLPGVMTCMMCHEEPLTEAAEEEKIRQLAEAGEERVFRKLFRLADHVYYSHRRHVEIAGIECATCHGEIASTEAPPRDPLVRITMDFCIDCHQRQEITVSCTSCHR